MNKIVDDVIEPFEIIDAFFLFRAGPSGLKSYPLDAESGDFVVCLRRIEDGAI